MAFWGCILQPGQKKKIESPLGDILHLSQACLHEPKDGKNYIQAEVEGSTYAIACLEKGKKEHDSFDLFFNPTHCAFMNSGKSEVHLTGYFEPDEEEEEEEEEEEAAATKKGRKTVAGKTDAPKSPAASPKGPVASPKVAASAPPETGKKASGSPKASPQSSPKASTKAAATQDDDDELDEGEEGEEEEEQEESEEEDVPVPKAKAKAEKRKSEETTASPAKKAKGEASKAAAASPKVEPAPKAAAKEASGDQADYVKSLVDYLKKNGKTSVSLLGGKVPRPAGAPKLKVVFQRNEDKFVVKDGNVSLK